MPTRLTPDAFEAQVRAGALDRVYLLTGPDAELKSRLSALLVESLDEGLRAFNLDRLHASDSRPEARKQLWAILDLARTLPMMAPFRLILLHGAEKLVAVLKDSEGGAAELEAFEAYLKAPEPHAVLVLVVDGSLDRRLKASMLIEKHASVVACDALAGSDDASSWIRAEAEKEGVRVEAAAIRLLSTLAGNDISRLRSEFERALMFTGPEGVVTEAAVQEIASAATSRSPYGLTNAIERGDRATALRELALRLEAGEVPVMVLGLLAWMVRTTLAPARAAAAVDAVFRTDLAMKTSRGDPRVLLERLVVELCS